jgi:hypothetical protein
MLRRNLLSLAVAAGGTLVARRFAAAQAATPARGAKLTRQRSSQVWQRHRRDPP